MKSINIIKLKNLPNENPDFIKKQKDHFWKSMLFLGLITSLNKKQSLLIYNLKLKYLMLF